MQFANETILATHASIVASNGRMSWVLFTGPKGEAAKAIAAISDTINLIGAGHLAAPFTIQMYYHQEVK